MHLPGKHCLTFCAHYRFKFYVVTVLILHIDSSFMLPSPSMWRNFVFLVMGNARLMARIFSKTIIAHNLKPTLFELLIKLQVVIIYRQISAKNKQFRRRIFPFLLRKCQKRAI
ncbi:unnamed protein product [Musa textilis]